MLNVNSPKLHTTRLSPTIGSIVTGLDLSAELPDSMIFALRDLLENRLVLFFEDQSLTPVQQRDFASRFGDLYVHPFYEGHGEAPEIMVLANDETRRANADRWHNDATYIETPPKAAVLYAEDVPCVGGDTLWANMYLAYERLSPPMQTFVSSLRAVHSFAVNFTPQRFRVIGMEERQKELYAAHPPVSHPVARTSPDGRKALFVNQDFTSHIEGMSPRESELVLRFLYEHMAQPEFQVRWHWRPNTVAFWDNRWAQHCALADYFPQRRRVRRATIIGEKPV
jgi:taurine dioxygenase